MKICGADNMKKHSGKYMAQRQGLFGLEIGYSKTIKGAFRNAKINPNVDDYGLFTCSGDNIVRIKANGQNY